MNIYCAMKSTLKHYAKNATERSQMLVPAIKRMCEVCQKNEATQLHHIFPNHKNHRKLYGSLLDRDFNLLPVCEHCHVSHREMAGRIEGEMWFRDQLEWNGYPVPPMSKTLMTKTRFR